MKTSRDKINSKISDATDISKPWDKDNQAWWDWYVGLADNEIKNDPIISADPLPNITIPSDDEIIFELNKTYHLKNDQNDFFRKNGFIKLKKVFSPGVVLKLRAELIKLLKKFQNKYLFKGNLKPDNAVCVIITYKGKMLLQKRDNKKNIFF